MMTKEELRKAKDSEVVADYISTYAYWVLELNDSRGKTKALRKHLDILEAEALRRGIMTEEQIDMLNR